MLLAALKRRWPVLTTVIAGLFYLVNNYDIRGLDGLRLEPKPGTPSPAIAPFQPGGSLGWGSSFPVGPPLPGLSGNGLSGTGMSGYGVPASTGFPPSSTLGASGGLGGQVAYSPSAAGSIQAPLGAGPADATTAPARVLPGTSGRSPAAGGSVVGTQGVSGSTMVSSPNWGSMLSVGEKLGMLERAQDPSAPPSLNIGFSSSESSANPTHTASKAVIDTIRIASFDTDRLGESKTDLPGTLMSYARLLSQFDIVALQNIRTRRDDLLPELVARLNSTGKQYDFMIGPRVGRSEQKEQFAFIFDTQRIETDRFQLYTVEDPEDMLQFEPLVGWFRTRGVPEHEAFTFSLINLHCDRDFARSEIQALPNLIQAIANDGRGEDDLIFAGNFGVDATQMVDLQRASMRIALDGVATNIQGNAQLDNVVFPMANCTEYTGRTGAYDFLRLMNLSLEQATNVSQHLPVWVEFSIIEGGRPGQVAGNGSLNPRSHNPLN